MAEHAPRSSAGVSPVRIADRRARGTAWPSRSAARPMPASGAAQVLLDVDGEGPQRRDVEQAQALRLLGSGWVTSRSMPHRNAASVLPDPVGARISVVPVRDGGPALRLGAVGAANVVGNHARTGSLKRWRTSSLIALTVPANGGPPSVGLRTTGTPGRTEQRSHGSVDGHRPVHPRPARARPPGALGAVASGRVVPVFVFDEAILRRRTGPNRAAFLLDGLRISPGPGRPGCARWWFAAATRHEVAELTRRGGAARHPRLRRWERPRARRRRRLQEAVAESGAALRRPRRHRGGGPARRRGAHGPGHYQVFSAYCRRWVDAATPRPWIRPTAVAMPRSWLGRMPAAAGPVPTATRPRTLPAEVRPRDADAWRPGWPAGWPATPTATTTSPPTRRRGCRRTSTLGCLSPIELVVPAGRLPGSGGVRPPARLARLPPSAAHRPSTGRRARTTARAATAGATTRRTSSLARGPHRLPRRRRRRCASCCGRGGCTTERGCIVGLFLTKTSTSTGGSARATSCDLLVDGDIANNRLNWQWVAGTGHRQPAEPDVEPACLRGGHDPSGAYVRRYVPARAPVRP